MSVFTLISPSTIVDYNFAFRRCIIFLQGPIGELGVCYVSNIVAVDE